ncbi:hypothetical protein B0H13DRAFT_2371031 [Mycena leptocephala]|nr:hypothetical protein B0H13DRAFT_2371031 [Mycena leptocephala]
MSQKGDPPLVTDVTTSMQKGFVGLRALHGDLYELPVQFYFGLYTGSLWSGPAVAAMIEESAAQRQKLRDGLPLPAHDYSELTTPIWSCWWSPAIRQLHRDASMEESLIKLDFFRRYPALHPHRLAESPDFLRDNIILQARLASSHAIFFLRCRVFHGVTAATDARAGALAAVERAAASLAAAAMAESLEPLMTDEYLSAWLHRPTARVSGWGTADDPRMPPPPPPPSANPNIAGAVNPGSWGGTGGGWANPAFGQWGNAGNGPIVGGWGQGGGWDANGWEHHRRRRWFPRHYGHHLLPDSRWRYRGQGRHTSSNTASEINADDCRPNIAVYACRCARNRILIGFYAWNIAAVWLLGNFPDGESAENCEVELACPPDSRSPCNTHFKACPCPVYLACDSSFDLTPTASTPLNADNDDEMPPLIRADGTIYPWTWTRAKL